jgi:hypothetical protein
VSSQAGRALLSLLPNNEAFCQAWAGLDPLLTLPVVREGAVNVGNRPLTEALLAP